MKKLVNLLFVMILGVTLSSCSSNDGKIDKAVEAQLQSVYPQINSSVNKGVVTLTGTVNSQASKEGAETVARNVKNVKSVVNNITVNAPVVNTPSTPVVVYSDEVIESNIKTALDKKNYNDVTIDVNNGEVTLRGNVKRANLEEVMRIANESKPKRVVNELIIQ